MKWDAAQSYQWSYHSGTLSAAAIHCQRHTAGTPGSHFDLPLQSSDIIGGLLPQLAACSNAGKLAWGAICEQGGGITEHYGEGTGDVSELFPLAKSNINAKANVTCPLSAADCWNLSMEHLSCFQLVCPRLLPGVLSPCKLSGHAVQFRYSV